MLQIYCSHTSAPSGDALLTFSELRSSETVPFVFLHNFAERRTFRTCWNSIWREKVANLLFSNAPLEQHCLRLLELKSIGIVIFVFLLDWVSQGTLQKFWNWVWNRKNCKFFCFPTPPPHLEQNCLRFFGIEIHLDRSICVSTSLCVAGEPQNVLELDLEQLNLFAIVLRPPPPPSYREIMHGFFRNWGQLWPFPLCFYLIAHPKGPAERVRIGFGQLNLFAIVLGLPPPSPPPPQSSCREIMQGFFRNWGQYWTVPFVFLLHCASQGTRRTCLSWIWSKNVANVLLSDSLPPSGATPCGIEVHWILDFASKRVRIGFGTKRLQI